MAQTASSPSLSKRRPRFPGKKPKLNAARTSRAASLSTCYPSPAQANIGVPNPELVVVTVSIRAINGARPEVNAKTGSVAIIAMFDMATALDMATPVMLASMPILRQCCGGQGQSRQHGGRKSKLVQHNGLFLLHTHLDDPGDRKLRGPTNCFYSKNLCR